LTIGFCYLRWGQRKLLKENKMKIFKYILILSLLCFLWLNTLSAEEKVTMTMSPACRTFYAGREHTLTVKTQGLTGERLSWNLRYAGRTLASGQRQVPQNGEVKISFQFPELNEGVVAEVEFSCFTGEKNVVRDPGSELGEEELKKTLYFFYPDPFKNKKEALKKLKIGIWEPSEGEALSEFLKSIEVPYAKVADPAGFQGEVLLVSGIDFDEFPGGNETLLKLVKNGKKVIILQPFSGTFAKLAEDMDSIIFTGNEYINGRNTFGVPPKGGTPNRRKFDTESWNGKPIANKSMKLVAVDDSIALEVREHRTSPVAKAMGDRSNVKRPTSNDKTKGFTYCEVRKGKGSLIITTWNIIKGAKESPTPVYLLKEMLVDFK
jgi:hypothetical protein